MTANVCGIDRITRIVAGVALTTSWALTGGPGWAWIGIVSLVTGALGICPTYSMLSLSSCGERK